MSFVDVHCHLVPRDLPALLQGIPGVRYEGARLVVEGREFPFPQDLRAPHQLWRRLEPDGWAVISPPPALYLYALAPDRGAAYARQLNDGLIECAREHERAVVLGWLPLQSPGGALEEIRRLATEPMVVGVVVGTSRHPLSDPELDQVWRRTADEGFGILIHPSGDPLPESSIPRRGPALGFPVETTLVALDLLFSDSSMWSPGVQLCLCHGGGFLIAALERVLRAAGDGAAEQVRPRVARLWVDGVLFDQRWRRLIVDALGPDRILPGSDWPFDLRLSDEQVRQPFEEATRPALERAAQWCPRLQTRITSH